MFFLEGHDDKHCTSHSVSSDEMDRFKNLNLILKQFLYIL